MCKGIGNSTPWLILAGSGGVADILVTLMNRGSWDTDSVHELLLDTFPNAHHSTDISNWVKLVRAMCTAWSQHIHRYAHHKTWMLLGKWGTVGKIAREANVGFSSLSSKFVWEDLKIVFEFKYTVRVCFKASHKQLKLSHYLLKWGDSDNWLSICQSDPEDAW